MKKIVALLLALVMTLSLATVAFAAESNKSPVEKLTEFAANTIAPLLYQPAKYLAGVIDENTIEVVRFVDAVGGEINDAIAGIYATVNETVTTAKGLVETAQNAVDFVSWLFDFFHIENDMQAWIDENMTKISDGMDQVAELDKYFGEIVKWTGKPTAKDATALTEAGQYVTDKADEIVEFLETQDNFTKTFGEKGVVATAIYNMIKDYYTGNFLKTAA